MRIVLFSLLLGGVAVGLAAAPGAQQPQSQAGPAGMSLARVQSIMDASARGLNYLPGEVVVKFRDGISMERRGLAIDRVRGRRTSRANVEYLGAVAVLHDTSGTDPRVLAAALEQQDDVEYAEPNYLYKIEPRNRLMRRTLTERDQLLQPRATTPNDPGFSPRQWNFAAIDMPRAWDIAPGGSSSIIVAVVDTGITTVSGNFTFKNWNGSAIVNQSFAFATNPDLSPSRLVDPYDFVNFSTTVLDLEGHGTHVSGTIGEDSNNALGDAGIAYRTRIMPVKVCSGYWDVRFARAQAGIPGDTPLSAGGCLNSTIALGIRYAADHGAKVINLSLGGPESATIRDAINYAVNKGAFVAAAGGNEFEDGNLPDYPAADAPSIDGFMSVAATGNDNARAPYSNTGSYIEIAAPGGDAKDFRSVLSFVWQATLLFDDQDPLIVHDHPRFDRYEEVGAAGTSTATPHIAGTAALLMSRGVTSPAAIEAILKKTAKDIGDAGKDSSFGYGLIQPRAALFGVGAIK